MDTNLKTLQLQHLKPSLLWKHFENICYLPRPSKHEEKIQAYIEAFAKEHSLWCKRDEVGNIILRKAATAGMEKRKRILLQSHIDMVPQKNSDVTHDFFKDPIVPCIREGHVYSSKRTTLGADNGIGVAAMLAVFESQDVPHGPLEALFTVDEEVGMGGALGLKAGVLQSEVMFNLDSESEGEIFIGCAGGVNTNAVGTYKAVSLPTEYGLTYDLTISGARGGHSGLDIPLKRANAIKLMARLLFLLREKGISFALHSFEGGTLRNAIARECFAKLSLSTKAFEQTLAQFQQTLREEYAHTDPEIVVNAVEVGAGKRPLDCMESGDAWRFMNAIMGVFHGMKNSIEGMPAVAETSTNLGIVIAKEGKIDIRTLQRSAIESHKFEMAQVVRSCLELTGWSVSHEGAYPGWRPNFNSQVLKVAGEVYERMFHQGTKTMVTHGGLECGLITSLYPGMDAISFGPNIFDAHSPNERVEIQSVERFWNYLLEMLRCH